MSGGPRSTSEVLQKQHYDAIAEEYERHYSDKHSVAYRREFLYDPMFGGVDLAGANVLEAMCGDGSATDYLVEHGAKVTGLDISGAVIDSFRRKHPECHAIQASVLETGLADNSFDGVVIIGGFHHLHPHMDRGIVEIHRILKPGGFLCFMEPHKGSLPDVVRKVWYRYDRGVFGENEEAVDIDSILREHSARFDCAFARYIGNIAYLLVFNSFVFRVPHALKALYAPTLMLLERPIASFQGKFLACVAICRLIKRA